MAANGISTLPTKEDRQIAKLDLAAGKRGESYDRDLLPTKYVGNTVVNNPNLGGLQPHRPWITGAGLVPYPQRTNYAFDFVTPPTAGTVWNDDVNQVSITIYGAGTRTSSYGRGIVFNGTDTYLEVLDNTVGVSTVTISMAANFQSANGNWNPVYHGGPYGSNDVFAYIAGGNTDSMSVGTGQTFEPSSAIVNNGLAWWDFVYDGTDVTVYKNGVQVLTGTLNTANSAFNQNILFGARYNGGDINNGDFLNGTIYRIKGVLSALDSSAIITQYNSIRTTYSLPAVPVPFYKLTILTNSDGGLIGWGAGAMSIPYSTDVMTIYPVGSTITWQDGTIATITGYDPYAPNYIDVFWDTAKTGTLFPITLKTSNYPPSSTYSSTQSVVNSGSNAVHIDTNPTNDAWASTVPIGATIEAAGYGTFTVTGVITPTDPGNISANWFFNVSPNTSYFPGGTVMTFTWTV